MWESAISAIREFITWWLGLFGVSDPLFVNFGMAGVALFAFFMAAALVFGIIGAIADAAGR